MNLTRRDRSSTSVMYRKEAEAELKVTIKNLASYVDMYAQGDPVKINSSGFKVRKNPDLTKMFELHRA